MKKLYYSIGEVSKITDVKPHVLRYWETQFKELSPQKNRGGKRIFTDKDIQVVFELKKLVQEDKFSTSGARKALQSIEPTKPELSPEVKKDLGEIKAFLQKIAEKL